MDFKDKPLLQNLGEKLREIDNEVWVKYTYKRAKNYSKVVISDCRRKNELKRGLELGFVPIRVISDKELRKQRMYERDGVIPDESAWEHEAEKGTEDCKMIEIDNNGTFEELYKQIDEFMNNFRRR